MKTRELKKLLNDTEYFITNDGGNIAIGTSMCHNLITVNRKTLKISYAIDTWHEGRNALKSEKLKFIWDKLEELIASGKIGEIIEKDDVIENPITVFTCENGKIIERHTDKLGWPNVTHDGFMMWDNTYFTTRLEAIEYGILAIESRLQYSKENREGLLLKLEECNSRIADTEEKLANLKKEKES